MDTPKYTSTITIGGQNQDTYFSDAFPKPTSSANDGIINRQSGELVLTCLDDSGAGIVSKFANSFAMPAA